MAGLKRLLKIAARTTCSSAHTSIICFILSGVTSKGFSHMMCFPALAAAIVGARCAPEGVAMVTISTDLSASKSSKLLYALQLYFLPSSEAFTGLRA